MPRTRRLWCPGDGPCNSIRVGLQTVRYYRSEAKLSMNQNRWVQMCSLHQLYNGHKRHKSKIISDEKKYETKPLKRGLGATGSLEMTQLQWRNLASGYLRISERILIMSSCKHFEQKNPLWFLERTFIISRRKVNDANNASKRDHYGPSVARTLPVGGDIDYWYDSDSERASMHSHRRFEIAILANPKLCSYSREINVNYQETWQLLMCQKVAIQGNEWRQRR